MRLRIAIRCDGSNSLGMGHIRECVSLAAALEGQAPCDIHFLTKRATTGAALLGSLGRPQVPLDFHDLASELAAIARLMKERPVDALIVSLPHRTGGYYRRLKRLTPWLAAIFDDGRPHAGMGHLVVDYCIRQSERAGRAGAEETHLLGPRYCLLDPGIALRRPLHGVRALRRLLVNQGGSDPFALTPRILKSVAKLPAPPETFVVLGDAAAASLIREVRRLRGALGYPCRVEVGLSPARFHALMARCDAAVTAAGNTLYELCAIGVPALVICHHKRHEAVASEFHRRHAALNLGIGPRLSDQQMTNRLIRAAATPGLLSSLRRHARLLVDGRGCARVAREILGALRAS